MLEGPVGDPAEEPEALGILVEELSEEGGAAERSSVSAGTSLRMVEAEPTSTWASAGATAALPAASKKPRRADHGDEGAAEGGGHKKHMQE